jgi:hypothetical protein
MPKGDSDILELIGTRCFPKFLLFKLFALLLEVLKLNQSNSAVFERIFH